MANNILSNGRIQQQTTAPQRLRSDKGKKAPEVPAIECNNWLLHRHYTRHEYKTCKTLIDQELMNSNGHNEYANYLKGLILRREGKVQDSLNCFQAAYTVNSTNINNVKQIAKSLLIMGSHKRAIDAYLEAEKISNTPDWEVYLNLGKAVYRDKSIQGECYVKLNELHEAKKYLKRSIELTKDESPYIALARVLLLQDQVVEARSAYSAVISANPECTEATSELGLLYLKTGDVQRAFQHFGTALAHSPNCTKAILPLAYIIQNHQEYDVALSKYKLAAQSIPESHAVWNNVGMCFYGKQKFVATEPTNVTADSTFRWLWRNKSWVEVDGPIPDKFFACCANFLEIKYRVLPVMFEPAENGSQCSRINYNFHCVFRYSAITCLKRAHYLNPMAFMPAYNLGMVLLTTGQPASAAIYLCAAVSADPKNHMPYLLLGLALKRLDDLEGAEKVLQKAHALSPQDPLVLINYAIVLDAVGKRSYAAEFLTALNDITAVIDVDAQITQTAKRLSTKLQQEKASGNEGERVLNEDEV